MPTSRACPSSESPSTTGVTTASRATAAAASRDCCGAAMTWLVTRDIRGSSGPGQSGVVSRYARTPGGTATPCAASTASACAGWMPPPSASKSSARRRSLSGSHPAGVGLLAISESVTTI